MKPKNLCDVSSQVGKCAFTCGYSTVTCTFFASYHSSNLPSARRYNIGDNTYPFQPGLQAILRHHVKFTKMTQIPENATRNIGESFSQSKQFYSSDKSIILQSIYHKFFNTTITLKRGSFAICVNLSSISMF